MSNRLEAAIAEYATQFAKAVVGLLGTVQVSELVAIATGGRAPTEAPAFSRRSAGPAVASAAKPERATKGGRRSSEDILAELDRIVAALKDAPGLRSEELQKKLGIAAKDIERPITIGLGKGLLKKTGEKRATRYSAGGGGKKATAPAKKAAAKKAPAKKAIPAKKVAAPAKKVAPKKPAKKSAAKKAPAKKGGAKKASAPAAAPAPTPAAG